MFPTGNKIVVFIFLLYIEVQSMSSTWGIKFYPIIQLGLLGFVSWPLQY